MEIGLKGLMHTNIHRYNTNIPIYNSSYSPLSRPPSSVLFPLFPLASPLASLPYLSLLSFSLFACRLFLPLASLLRALTPIFCFRSFTSLLMSAALRPSYRNERTVKPINTSGWANSLAREGTSLPTKGTAVCVRECVRECVSGECVCVCACVCVF